MFSAPFIKFLFNVHVLVKLFVYDRVRFKQTTFFIWFYRFYDFQIVVSSTTPKFLTSCSLILKFYVASMQSLRDIVSSADEPVAVRDLRLIVSNAESRYHLFHISASMEPHGNTPPGHICAFVYHIYI